MTNGTGGPLNPERMKILSGDDKKRYDNNFDKIKKRPKEEQEAKLISNKNGVKTYRF